MMASASSNDPTSSTSNSILIDHSTDFATAAASSIHFNDFDTLNEVPMNLLPADKHPYWNNVPSGRTNIEDPPQLEYDEHDIHLIASREVYDEFEYDGGDLQPHIGFAQNDGDPDFSDEDFIPGDVYDQTGVIGQTTQTRGLIKGKITSDGIIDDDFESELGGHEPTDLNDVEDADYQLVKKVADFNIVECCGDDKFGRKTIILSACRLPKEEVIRNSDFKTVDKFYECLLKYCLRTFDQYADMDYVVIYFHHGLRSYNRPSYSWLMKAYVKVDRKYKKNVKAVYIVHPTKWIKFLWPVLRPFISSKFSRKVTYINRLSELNEYVHLTNIRIPVEVKEFDPTISLQLASGQIRPTTKFHVSLEFILENEPGEIIPLVMRETMDFIKKHGLDEPGIFRRAALVSMIKQVQQKYNEGQNVSFEQYADIHLAACVLKTFLRDLSEPLMTFRLYPELLGLSGTLKRTDQIDVVRDLIIEKLPSENYHVLKYLIEFLNLVASHSDKNLMTTSNLSIVFGPNIAWPEDAAMGSLPNYSLINIFTEILIDRYTELFLK